MEWRNAPKLQCSEAPAVVREFARLGLGRVCSPTPQPSPSGRGSTVHQTRANSTRTDSSRDGRQFSLSLRERLGVRGNKPLESCTHASFPGASPTLHYSSTPSLRSLPFSVLSPFCFERISHFLLVLLEA